MELKADEFVKISGVTGLDIKAALLYDVGYQRETMIKTKRELKELEHKNKAFEIQLQNSDRQIEDLQMNNSKLKQDLEK